LPQGLRELQGFSTKGRTTGPEVSAAQREVRIVNWVVRLFAAVSLSLLMLVSAPASARVEKITVHGKSLEGNLEGNSADRTVLVLLPPSYDTAKRRRYPVLYFLHGYNSQAVGTVEWTKMEQRQLAAMKATGREFIVVAPDTDTLMSGSMYSDSPTVGNFEEFITRDLIAYIDSHYRTVAKRESRGLFGHSMGGYGTLRIAMHHPELYAAIYALDPCCLLPRQITAEQSQKYEGLTPEQVAKGDFGIRTTYAVAAAWSPDPGKPPFYADLPTSNGVLNPLVIAEWYANAPTAMVPQFLPALKSLTAIGMETGTKDFVKADVEAMHAQLLKFGIKHDWYFHDGDHGSKVSEDLEKIVFPFFVKHIVFPGQGTAKK
jgi:S-formylglutathione hydrolase FrmB